MTLLQEDVDDCRPAAVGRHPWCWNNKRIFEPLAFLRQGDIVMHTKSGLAAL